MGLMSSLFGKKEKGTAAGVAAPVGEEPIEEEDEEDAEEEESYDYSDAPEAKALIDKIISHDKILGAAVKYYYEECDSSTEQLISWYVQLNIKGGD